MPEKVIGYLELLYTICILEGKYFCVCLQCGEAQCGVCAERGGAIIWAKLEDVKFNKVPKQSISPSFDVARDTQPHRPHQCSDFSLKHHSTYQVSTQSTLHYFNERLHIF